MCICVPPVLVEHAYSSSTYELFPRIARALAGPLRPRFGRFRPFSFCHEFTRDDCDEGRCQVRCHRVVVDITFIVASRCCGENARFCNQCQRPCAIGGGPRLSKIESRPSTGAVWSSFISCDACSKEATEGRGHALQTRPSHRRYCRVLKESRGTAAPRIVITSCAGRCRQAGSFPQ